MKRLIKNKKIDSDEELFDRLSDMSEEMHREIIGTNKK